MIIFYDGSHSGYGGRGAHGLVLGLHPDGVAFWGMPDQDGDVFERYLNTARDMNG